MPAITAAPIRSLLLLLCLAMVACQREAPVEASSTIVDMPATTELGGAISGGVTPSPAPKAPGLEGTQWPPVELTSGEAWVNCSVDDVGGEQGVALTDLSFSRVVDALTPCEEAGVLRVGYSGKIGADFTALVERVANVAGRLKISRRLLDLDSSGGHIEDAMKAGDAIGASQWTLRVGEQAICHSSCVLILAAGDDRQIAGKVGIHRMMRVGSAATTRSELSQELREVYVQMKEYLERNGAAVTVADLMMTVPNRKLRLLSEAELQEYGLEGTNAVQDDLERIRLTRECGDDFVRRKDDYTRAYDRQCAQPQQDEEQRQACGLALREGFGFPDEKCPVESPLSEHDRDDPPADNQAGME